MRLAVVTAATTSDAQPLRLFWFRLGLDRIGRMAIVLDASQSAQEHWERIDSLARGLLHRLPAALSVTVHFLGSGDCLGRDDFQRLRADYSELHEGRLSIIGPVYETLSRETEIPDTILVIGSGTVFDAADWDGTSLATRTTWAHVGHAPLTDQASAEIGQPTVDGLHRLLHDPPRVVSVGAPAAMPLHWDNRAYRYDGQALRAQITDGRETDVTAAFLAPSCQEVRAGLELASGKTQDCVLEQCAEHSLGDVRSGYLASADMLVFDSCSCGQTYRCPHCTEQHRPDQVRCTRSRAIRGPLALTTLKDLLPGVVLLKRGTKSVSYVHSALGVLQVGPDRVVILGTDFRQARLAVFDHSSGRWMVETPPLNQFALVAEDTYAVVI